MIIETGEERLNYNKSAEKIYFVLDAYAIGYIYIYMKRQRETLYRPFGI
jgi:hypothetical protein